MSEEELNTLLQFNESPKYNALFRQRATRVLQNCSFQQLLKFFIHFQLDFETVSSMISVERLFTYCQQLINDAANQVPEEYLFYTHYLNLNLTCLMCFSVSPYESFNYLTQHKDDDLLSFLKPEIHTILGFAKLPDLPNIEAPQEPQEPENGPIVPPQFEYLTNMNRLFSPENFDNQKFAILEQHLEQCFNNQTAPNSSLILQLMDELTKNFQTFSYVSKYFLSRPQNTPLFVCYLLTSTELEVPKSDELVFGSPYVQAKNEILISTPKFDKIPNNSTDLVKNVEELLTVSGDLTYDPNYYIVAAYLAEGNSAIEHYIDYISLCFYLKSSMALDDQQAMIGIDVFYRSHLKCYCPFFLQVEYKTMDPVKARKTILMHATINDIIESLPYIFDLKMFFRFWDINEEEDPKFIDPRSDRVVKMLIAGQYKRIEKQPTFYTQCVFSFFNDISKKINKCARLPFPQNKE